MKTYSKEELDKQFDKAPEIIREALFAKETSDAVKKIGEKYKLHIDQIGSLADEIGLVILGLESSSGFVDSVIARLNVEKPAAEQIATDANQEIFLKIRESLKQMEENKNTPKPEELLHELERHTSPAAMPEKPSIFERKLSEPVNLKPETSAPPPTPAPEIPIKKVDPYHEPIE